MNRYTIYCTEEQTIKAFDLGAPIEQDASRYDLYGCVKTGEIEPYTGYNIWLIPPTAEQMCGWLEEQGLVIDIVNRKNACHWSVWLRKNSQVELVLINDSINNYCTIYKEAVINAITAALDYLTDRVFN